MKDVKNLVVRLYNSTYQLLIEYCELYGLTMHTVITKAVEAYCEDSDNNEKGGSVKV